MWIVSLGKSGMILEREFRNHKRNAARGVLKCLKVCEIDWPGGDIGTGWASYLTNGVVGLAIFEPRTQGCSVNTPMKQPLDAKVFLSSYPVQHVHTELMRPSESAVPFPLKIEWYLSQKFRKFLKTSGFFVNTGKRQGFYCPRHTARISPHKTSLQSSSSGYK